jgi:broad specificity phosphatase PhoE
MTKLIYVTHPSVIFSQEIPIDQWGLSEKGKEEAKNLVEMSFWNEVDVLYSSTETKAYELADIIKAKFNIDYEKFDELKEADRSSTGALPLEEYMQGVRQAYLNPDIGFSGWESHRLMMQRNSIKVEEIMEKHKDQTVAIIGHGGAGTVLKCYIKGIEPDFAEDPKITGCFWICDWDNKKIIQDWQKY